MKINAKNLYWISDQQQTGPRLLVFLPFLLHIFEGGVGAYKKPKNRAKNRPKPQDISLKSKTDIKALTEKALVVLRIFLSVIQFLYI